MLELLPNTQKKALKREYFLRLSVAALSFSFAAGILFLVSFSPSYFLSVVKGKVVNEEFENMTKSSRAKNDEELRTAIKKSREMIALLKPEGNESLVKDKILKIINRKSSGIRIDGLSINYSKNGQYQIIVTGASKSRDTLKSFADNLKSEKDFIEVDLPISNFAKIADIDFSIAIKTAI